MPFCLHECLYKGVRYPGMGVINSCDAMGMLGIEVRSVGRAVSALNLVAISPALVFNDFVRVCSNTFFFLNHSFILI